MLQYKLNQKQRNEHYSRFHCFSNNQYGGLGSTGTAAMSLAIILYLIINK